MDQRLSYEDAKSLASNLKSSSDNIKSLLEESDREVKDVRNNWEGSSATVAMDQWETWKKDFDEYYQMLIANVENIKTTCEEYAKTEENISRGFNG